MIITPVHTGWNALSCIWSYLWRLSPKTVLLCFNECPKFLPLDKWVTLEFWIEVVPCQVQKIVDAQSHTCQFAHNVRSAQGHKASFRSPSRICSSKFLNIWQIRAEASAFPVETSALCQETKFLRKCKLFLMTVHIIAIISQWWSTLCLQFRQKYNLLYTRLIKVKILVYNTLL